MDGAATHHITPYKHAFSSLETTGIPQLTQVAGPTAKAGKGTVRLAVKQPQQQPQVVAASDRTSWQSDCICAKGNEIAVFYSSQVVGAHHCRLDSRRTLTEVNLSLYR
jgi:hypothetical protein